MSVKAHWDNRHGRSCGGRQESARAEDYYLLLASLIGVDGVDLDPLPRQLVSDGLRPGPVARRYFVSQSHVASYFVVYCEFYDADGVIYWRTRIDNYNQSLLVVVSYFRVEE